jgi:hypothetical protein
VNPSSHSSEHAEPAEWLNMPSMALTPAAALMERALLDDPEAAIEVIRRLAGGDASLSHTITQAESDTAARLRAVLLHFVALGTWQGHLLPLPAGYHAGFAGQHLRDLIAGAVCTETSPVWQLTLVDGLRDPVPAVRQTCAMLLAGCHKPMAATALVATLSDRDEGVRWAAALALTHGDQAVVVAVLRRLTSPEFVPEMRHVTAYMLRYLRDPAVRQVVAPVVHALDGTDYRVTAPMAAGAALAGLSAQ